MRAIIATIVAGLAVAGCGGNGGASPPSGLEGHYAGGYGVTTWTPINCHIERNGEIHGETVYGSFPIEGRIENGRLYFDYLQGVPVVVDGDSLVSAGGEFEVHRLQGSELEGN